MRDMVCSTLSKTCHGPECILNTCNDPLCDNIRKGLIYVSSLELGGPLVFKLMMNIVLDVEDSALRSMMQNLQTLRLKDGTGGMLRRW